jgi:hypothetical protein
MHTTQIGNIVTLLFHTYYSCAGTVIGSEHICFNPTYYPREQWLEIRSVQNPGNVVSCTQVFSPDKPVSMLFDACAAIDKDGCGGIGCGCGGPNLGKSPYIK